MIKKEKKMYFDEASFQEMILEYQKTAVVMGKVTVKKDEKLERKIVNEVQKIVMAIINQYRYGIFEDIDDLKQEGLKACYMNFMKFHPSKGSAFNYFSIITKIHLLNYTDRRKRHRNLSDVDECMDLECAPNINYEFFFENLEDTLFRLVDENYVGSKRKKYVRITSVIVDYLRKSQKYVSKSDLYAWARSYGFKSMQIREYINDLSQFSEDIMILCGE